MPDSPHGLPNPGVVDLRYPRRSWRTRRFSRPPSAPPSARRWAAIGLHWLLAIIFAAGFLFIAGVAVGGNEVRL